MKQELKDMLEACSAELDDIEERINNLHFLDKARRYFTNYALIKACGTAEFVYRSIVANHFSRLSDSKINNYLDKTIMQGSMSATYKNMQNLLGKFDDSWKENFKNVVQSRRDKDRLISSSNSLVNNRHSFAHGRTPTATFLEIKQYYTDVVQLIEIFDRIVC